MNKLKNTERLIQSCDECGITIFYITGSLSEELFTIINNNSRYVNNTEILCKKCINKKVEK